MCKGLRIALDWQLLLNFLTAVNDGICIYTRVASDIHTYIIYIYICSNLLLQLLSHFSSVAIQLQGIKMCKPAARRQSLPDKAAIRGRGKL